MNELDYLRTIRPIWVNRAVQSMARGAGMREDLREQLQTFFGLLEQGIETGDPAWLDSIINVWAASLTSSDLEENRSSLTHFVSELMQLTHSVCSETLDEPQALALIRSLTPCFTYTYEKAAQYEIEAKVNYVNNQLNQVRQTLERLDKSKSDFIAVAAHELKTPLTLVEGYAAMLRENLERKNFPETDMMLIAGINNGARRLRSIIDDMIDVSLIDNRLMSLNLQPIWFNRLFSVLENELATSLKEREQTLIINDFPGSTEMTFGDPERILQVFRNLLMNAIKFTPNGGQISIDGRKLPGFIDITVRDSGIGIAQDDLAIIFEKFARLGNVALHSSGKTKFKGGGPGLGLHIAKGIVEAHGGAIWVESDGYDEEQCPGSVFHVLYPVHNEPPDTKTAKLFAPLLKSYSNQS